MDESGIASDEDDETVALDGGPVILDDASFDLLVEEQNKVLENKCRSKKCFVKVYNSPVEFEENITQQADYKRNTQNHHSKAKRRKIETKEDHSGLLSEKVYTVQKILDKRVRQNGAGIEYLVKWRYYEDPKWNSWEPADNLGNALQAIKEFEEDLETRINSKPSRNDAKIHSRPEDEREEKRKSCTADPESDSDEGFCSPEKSKEKFSNLNQSVSEYEQIRLDNIKEREELLKSLGLAEDISSLKSSLGLKSKGSKAPSPKQTEEKVERRKSARLEAREEDEDYVPEGGYKEGEARYGLDDPVDHSHVGLRRQPCKGSNTHIGGNERKIGIQILNIRLKVFTMARNLNIPTLRHCSI